MEKIIRMFINFKGVIRLLAFIAIIMFFVPSYAISCSGYDINLSQANLAIGKSVTFYGETERTSFFLPFLLALLIPIAIIVISFLWKKENEKLMSLVSTVGGAAGFAMVFIMRIALVIYVAAHKDDYFDMSSHFKFGAFIIVLLYLGIVAISLLSMLKKIDPDKCFLKEDVIKKMAGGAAVQPNPQTPIQPQPGAMGQPQAAPTATVTPGVKYCSKCGNQLTAEMLFCGKCGTKCE